MERGKEVLKGGTPCPPSKESSPLALVATPMEYKVS